MSDPALARFNALFGPEFGHGRPFDLAPLRAALAALGDPQEKLPPVIHVAGTNGKGSTIAFLRAMAEAAGWRVHAFTKPHLFRLNERFVVASETARDDTLIATAEHVAAVAPTLTNFDAQIATAFTLFAQHDAQVVLLETGMGGRDDSTNVIAAPVASIITPIGQDHQDALGETVPEIAAHKAGILKRDAPSIIARQAPEAMAVIEAEAARVGASLFRCGVEWDAFVNAGRLVVQTEHRALDLPLPALAGTHQIENAGLAVAAILAAGLDIDDDAIARGVENARWPGRLQALTRGALSASIRGIGGEVWVDGGHNAHAASALTFALATMQRQRPQRTIAIVGLRKRKNAPAFIAALAPAISHLIAVPLADEHTPAEEIANLARAAGVSADTALSLSDAMQNAAQFPAPRVLICGSFLLAAEALGGESA